VELVIRVFVQKTKTMSKKCDCKLLKYIKDNVKRFLVLNAVI